MPTTKKATKKTTEETPKPAVKKSGKYFYANGKRKTSVARVRLYKGKGEMIVNEKPSKRILQSKNTYRTSKVPFQANRKR